MLAGRRRAVGAALGWLLTVSMMACAPQDDGGVTGVSPKKVGATTKPTTAPSSNSDPGSAAGSISNSQTPPPLLLPTPVPSATPTPFPPGNVLTRYPLQDSDPRALAFDAQGNAWVACAGGTPGKVDKVDPSGSLLIEPVVGAAPSAIAVDGSGTVWVANGGDTTLTKVTSGGNSSLVVGSAPCDLAVDGSGNVWTACAQGVVKVTTGGATQSITTPAAGGIALQGGNLWVSNKASSSVDVYDSSGNLLQRILTGNASSPSMVRASGTIVWVADSASNNVARIDTTHPVPSFIGLPGAPAAIATDATGDLWVSVPSQGKIVKIGPNGAYLKDYSVGSAPYGLAFAPDGRLWITDRVSNDIKVFVP